MKTNFNTRKFKGGAYASMLSAVVIALVIIINMLFTKLDLNMDITADGKYSLTKETITMLDELEDEIIFYYLAPSDASIDMFDKILSQYIKYGDTVKLVQKDPVLNPRFAAQYTEETVEEYSVIVVNESNGRSRYVPYSDMLIEEYGIDYTTYQYYSEITGLDMEGQLNSAIGYVTSENLPTLYELSGHGMQTLGTNAVSMLEKANIEVYYDGNSLDLLTTTEIPEDCEVLLLNAPQTDLTETEVALLTDFAAEGGNLIFVLSYLNAEHTNLMSLVNSYGVQMTDGILLEDNSRYYMQAPYVLVPTLSSHEITDDISSGKYIIAHTSNGLTFAEEVPENLTQSVLLKTSSGAYAKPIDFTTYYREDTDETGTFYLGVHVEDGNTGSEVAVFSSYYMFHDSFADGSTFGNVNLLINSVNALADIDNTTTAVRTISLTEDSYLTLTDAQINTTGLLTVIVLPLAFLITGIGRVVYRRKHS